MIWGLPRVLRVDNGPPWGTASDVPSALALWVVGLGVNVIYNRPRQSTDNGVVERAHGVAFNWVEVQLCHTTQQLQQRLNQVIHLQREVYAPSGDLPRSQRYPALYTNDRTYHPDQEATTWSYQRVAQWLAHRIFVRRVDKVGRISLFSQTYSVGRQYRGQDVTIRFDSTHYHWLIFDQQGRRLHAYAPKDVTPENIWNFTLTRRHDEPN